MEPEQPFMVFCTCPDAPTGQRLSRRLVEERLAACVNSLPGVTSTYRWQDGIEEAQEVLLVIKTCAGRLERLEGLIRSLHPYELPEIVAVPIVRASAPYLVWMRSALADPAE